jgi:hypothetical protein
MALFYTNFMEFYTPKPEGDTVVFPIYLPKNFRAPFVDPTTATGPAIVEIFANPDKYVNRSLAIIGDIISPQEMVDIFTKVTGKKAVYKSAYTKEEFLHYFPDFKSNELLVEEILGMVEYAVEFGYFSEKHDLNWSRLVNPKSLTWESFLRHTGWKGEKINF